MKHNLRQIQIVFVCVLLLASCSSEATPTPTRPIAGTAVPTALVPFASPLPAGPRATPEPGEPPPPPDEYTTPTITLAPFFDDRRLTYEPGFYAPQIQAFLDQQAGPLKSYVFQVGDRRHSFAEVLVGQTSYYSINPRVLLALIEAQSGLLTTAGPSSEQVGWAIGFRGDNGNRRGLQSQVRWAVRQIVYAKRDYPQYAPLTYADNTPAPAPPGMSLSEYVVARVLAPTTTPGRLPALMQRFFDTYVQLFEDPRRPPADWPPPAAAFLTRPNAEPVPVTSFFDHNSPFLTRDPDASITTYWGRDETDMAFAYDGHDGWDYAAAPPDKALAAADGEVVFAGNADDNCATRAVVLDHGNGYRTLYWHLARVDVEIGERVERSQSLGVIGESGCALGPHLHFGVQYLGRNTDPYGWCATTPDPWGQNAAGTPSTWLWLDRPSPCGPPPAGAVVVDAGLPGFYSAGEQWQTAPTGYGGSALFAASLRGADERQPWKLRQLRLPSLAIWRPELQAGRYRVMAYIPYALSGLEDAKRMHYRIRHADGEAEVMVDARVIANDWADLGTYTFTTDGGAVLLSNLVEENRLSVWADAVMWIPQDE